MREAEELSFPLDEYRIRLQKVRDRMVEEGLDMLLIHDLADQCYLTGYQTFDPVGYSCFFLPLHGDPVMEVWETEAAGVRLNAWVDDIAPYNTGRDPFDVTRQIIAAWGWMAGRIGVDQSALSLGDYRRLQSVLSGVDLVDLNHFVRTVRLVKTDREIEMIRQAGQITALGIEAATEAVRLGATDNTVAAAGYRAMIEAGSEYMCYSPIVTAGARSGVPHTTHKRIELQAGDPVFMEFGACFQRYNAPQMRTVFMAPQALDLTRVAEGVLTTLRDVIAGIRPGITGDDLAKIGQRGVEMAGSEIYFHGVFACSVGLGFPPTWEDHPLFLIRGETTELVAGMVFHLPIAFRLSGRGCVGFSETLVVTEDGCDVLTEGPCQMVIK